MINRGNAMRVSLLALTLGALIKLNYPTGTDVPIGVATSAIDAAPVTTRDVASVASETITIATPEPDPVVVSRNQIIAELTPRAECIVIPGWSWVIRREHIAVEILDHQPTQRWVFDALWAPATSASFEGAYWMAGEWEVAYIRRWDWTVFRRREADCWRFTVETNSFRALCQTIPLKNAEQNRSTIGVAESR